MDPVKWYYLDAGQQQGPTNTKNLQELLYSGELPAGTMVWTSTLSDWQPANTMGIFKQNKAPRLPHWLITFLLVFISMLGLGFGWKYLIKIKGQNTHLADITISKRVADTYKSESSLLLPDNDSHNLPKKAQISAKILRTDKAIAQNLSIIPNALIPNKIKKTEEEPPENIIGNLQAENQLLIKQVMELKATQEDPLAKTKILRLTQRLNQLKENYIDSKKENQLLRDKLKLEEQRPELALNVQLKKKLTETQSDLTRKTHLIGTLEKQLEISNASLNKAQSIKLAKHESRTMRIGHIAGVHGNSGTLVINLARTTIIPIGKTLYISSKATHESLGKATVSKILGSKCVAKFKGEKILSITLGDHVSWEAGQ